VKRAILLIEIDFVEGKEYIASERYVSRPTDTPANQYYDGVVEQCDYVRSISCVLWNNGEKVAAPLNRITCNNFDGSLDSWGTKTIKGQSVIGRLTTEIDTDSPIPAYTQVELADFEVVLTARGEDVVFDGDTCDVILGDKFATLFEKDELTTTYTSAGANPAQLNTVRPLVLGEVNFAPCKLIDTTNNKWDFNDEAYDSLIALRRGAYLLTLTTDYTLTTDGVDLVGAAQGFFQAQVKGCKRSGTWFDDLETMIKFAVLDRGSLSSGDLDSSLGTLSSALGYSFCFAAQNQVVKVGEFVRSLLDSVHAVVWQDRLGVLRFGQLELPTAPAVVEFVEADILEINRAMDKAEGLTQFLEYDKNYAVAANGDIAGAATAAERADSTRPVSYAVPVTPADPEDYAYPALARPPAKSLLKNSADAEAEIQARHDIYVSRRFFYRMRIAIPEGSVDAWQLEPLDIIKVTHSRYGLSSGVYMRVISPRSSFLNNTLEVLAWA